MEYNMDNVSRAVSLFDKGCNCAQAILSVYGERFGLSHKTALKLSAGFGGGMQMAETCGAVTAAIMVLGLKYGPAAAQDQNSKKKTYELTKGFISSFQARNGSVICKELLGCDITTPEGARTAKEKDLFDTRCTKLITEAVEILEEILADA